MTIGRRTTNLNQFSAPKKYRDGSIKKIPLINTAFQDFFANPHSSKQIEIPINNQNTKPTQ